MTTTEPSVETRKCQRCRRMVNLAETYAIGKTFVIFYYCPPCYEIAVNED